MHAVFDDLLNHYRAASGGFASRLAAVRQTHWELPTPCTEWTVRQLVNHMARGNLNYVGLLRGDSAREFVRLRDADALGTDPVAGFADSVRACAAAFAEPGALDRKLDYPLGTVSGGQALAIRTADSLIHTWDLATAIGADDLLDERLLTWLTEHLRQVYSGLAETPGAQSGGHRFFAAPVPTAQNARRQQRLLNLFGREPGAH